VLCLASVRTRDDAASICWRRPVDQVAQPTDREGWLA
jgi:hypothetical protein